MSRRSLRSFERRVGLFVMLVIALVLTLAGLHALEQARSLRLLEQAQAERARLTAELTVQRAGRERLVELFREWQSRGTRPPRLALSHRFLRERGISSVHLLSPEGWGIGSGLRLAPESTEGRERLDAATRRRLAAGEVVVDTRSGVPGDPVYAIVVARAPVLDGSAQIVGVVEVQVGAEALASARRRLRLGLLAEGGSILAFAILLVVFTRWSLRPLRLLERSAESRGSGLTALGPAELDLAELELAELEGADDTGFVIETYRGMIGELRGKEQELRRLRELERHRANELQDLNASIVDSMVSGILVLDLSGTIRSLNDVARDVLGVGGGRARGRPFADVLATVPELHPRLRACLDEGAVVRRDELRLNLPGVGRRDIGLTLSPLKDREGRRTGALCLVVDLTEIKRLQEQVRLKESLAELGELSGGVAHEFRNSLATMLGYAKLIERQAEGEVAEHARDIRDEVGLLRRVVDDFLRFANPTRLVLDRLDLAELFAELRADVEQRAGDKRVHYELRAAGLPVISGDETLLRRAFTNLLRNAVDAVQDGGRVEVSAETERGTLLVHVDDDGPGIPEEDRERIFIPFVSRKDSGTGLGLALARKVIVHHGGRIGVDRSPLGGARFSVSLPLRSEHEPNAGKPPEGSAASQDGNEK